MSNLTIDTTAMQSCTYNGNNVEKLIIDGTTVWENQSAIYDIRFEPGYEVVNFTATTMQTNSAGKITNFPEWSSVSYPYDSEGDGYYYTWYGDIINGYAHTSSNRWVTEDLILVNTSTTFDTATTLYPHVLFIGVWTEGNESVASFDLYVYDPNILFQYYALHPAGRSPYMMLFTSLLAFEAYSSNNDEYGFIGTISKLEGYSPDLDPMELHACITEQIYPAGAYSQDLIQEIFPHATSEEPAIIYVVLYAHGSKFFPAAESMDNNTNRMLLELAESNDLSWFADESTNEGPDYSSYFDLSGDVNNFTFLSYALLYDTTINSGVLIAGIG